MGHKSFGGAEYFLTLLDDKTHYTWVHPLKSKDQVFDKFKEWQAFVENHSGRKVKTFRTDNGEYLSREFQAHLKTCGIRHERTIPKTPEQNGAAERLNRTLVVVSGDHKDHALGCQATPKLLGRSPLHCGIPEEQESNFCS